MIRTFEGKASIPPLTKWDKSTMRLVEVSPGYDAVVEVSIDVEALIKVLGRKAAKNKSRKAIEIGGLVKASVL